MLYRKVREKIKNNPKTWLVTGAAGFTKDNLTIINFLIRDNYNSVYVKVMEEYKWYQN